MIQRSYDKIYVSEGNKVIIISLARHVYTGDIQRNFDYYFTAIEPKQIDNFLIADYSSIQDHDIVGFDLFKIRCPSLPDKYDTILQYLSFGDLSEGMVALDLGAYSALASIVFSLKVGKGGKIIAVEPDKTNYTCCIENINRFNKLTEFNNIKLINCAIWNECKPLLFSGEGCLGSFVITDPRDSRGELEHIQGVTLYELTKNLDRLDFIKCDIEHAEQIIFKDDLFFNRFRPKIIIEPHDCVDVCIKTLSDYNYKVEVIEQRGVSVPLLECTPL